MADPNTQPRYAPSLAAWLLMAGCLAGYAVAIAHGADWWDASASDLLRVGANYAPAVAAGESWRLVSSLFLHGGAVHLLINLVALADVATTLERSVGRGRTLAVFLASGIAGSLASAATHTTAISIGASGGIFGLFGAWVLVEGGEAPAAPSRRRMRQIAVAAYAVVALGLGFLIEGVDNAAHLGGFAVGAGLGRLARRPSAACGMAFWLVVGLAIEALAMARQVFPAEWAIPYREGLRFDAAYRQFAAADRQGNEALRAIGREARAGRLSDRAAVDRLEKDLIPRFEALNRGWLELRFADAGVERERLLWAEYSSLRLDALRALHRAATTGGPDDLKRFEARMSAAAALVESVRGRGGVQSGSPVRE